jgi:WD40 repeat protein
VTWWELDWTGVHFLGCFFIFNFFFFFFFIIFVSVFSHLPHGMYRQALASYRAHCSPVWDVCFAPAGTLFLSASHDHTARLWCPERAQPLRMLVGHHSDVTCCKFHGNGNYAATGSCDKTARLWDLNSGKVGAWPKDKCVWRREE